jgi:ArsR family transcriptional regulator
MEKEAVMTGQQIDQFAAQAAEAAVVLKSLAHEGRLLVLCFLAEAGEVSAGELTNRIGLSQSALSQHLARLRTEGLVTTRKQAQSVFYRIADPKVFDLLHALHGIYCPTLKITKPTEVSE